MDVGRHGWMVGWMHLCVRVGACLCVGVSVRVCVCGSVCVCMHVYMCDFTEITPKSCIWRILKGSEPDVLNELIKTKTITVVLLVSSRT